MIFVAGVVICGGPFQVLGMEEVHNHWANSRKFFQYEGVGMIRLIEFSAG